MPEEPSSRQGRRSEAPRPRKPKLPRAFSGASNCPGARARVLLLSMWRRGFHGCSAFGSLSCRLGLGSCPAGRLPKLWQGHKTVASNHEASQTLDAKSGSAIREQPPKCLKVTARLKSKIRKEAKAPGLWPLGLPAPSVERRPERTRALRVLPRLGWRDVQWGFWGVLKGSG